MFCKTNPDTSADVSKYSPIRASLRDLPPILVFVGENEFLYDSILEFCEKADTVECIVGERRIHVYFLLDMFFGILRAGGTDSPEVYKWCRWMGSSLT